MRDQPHAARLADALADADRIDPEEWPQALKYTCRDRCAKMGEPACWEVDEWINPRDPDRGKVCDECRADYAMGAGPEGGK